MDEKRWQEIKRIYESAAEVAPESRGEFLREACAGDESLREQVESFLECRPFAEEFLRFPAFKMAVPDPVVEFSPDSRWIAYISNESNEMKSTSGHFPGRVANGRYPTMVASSRYGQRTAGSFSTDGRTRPALPGVRIG
jgi:hypothetical protein